MPRELRDALAETFDVSVGVIDRVRIVEHSRFARLHGPHVAATTRRDAIYLAGAGERFVADPDLVLHEYFHVLRQWNAGSLTAFRYLRESLRHGYRGNRFEIEARDFARRHASAFIARLRAAEAAAVCEP